MKTLHILFGERGIAVHFKSQLFLMTIFIFSILGNALNVAHAEETVKDMQSKAENMAKTVDKLKASESFKTLQNKIQLQQQEVLNKARVKAESKYFSLPSHNPSLESTCLFIFISSSMPENSIKNYIKSAKKTGARLVLNGLIENDLPKTLKTVASWGTEEISPDDVIIDPVAYERFSVHNIPTIILAQAEYPCPGTTECSTSFVDKISGDITLDFALRKFLEKGDLKEEAQKYLTLLGESKNG